MAYRVSNEAELRELLGKKPESTNKLPKCAARNQSKLHTELVKSCHEWLLIRGYFCWRNNTGAARYGKQLVKFGVPGMPDILGCLKTGVLFGVECKTGAGKQSEDQYQIERRFTRNRALYVVIRDVDELRKWFK